MRISTGRAWSRPLPLLLGPAPSAPAQALPGLACREESHIDVYQNGVLDVYEAWQVSLQQVSAIRSRYVAANGEGPRNIAVWELPDRGSEGE